MPSYMYDDLPYECVCARVHAELCVCMCVYSNMLCAGGPARSCAKVNEYMQVQQCLWAWWGQGTHTLTPPGTHFPSVLLHHPV